VRVITIVLSTVLTVATLLSSTGAQAATERPTGAHDRSGKLNDKYWAGMAGGRLGIGGAESIKFPKQKNESLTADRLKFPKQKN